MRLCIFIMIPLFSLSAQVFWIETTQEDFADGIYERNLYASHRDGGAVEYVAKFDLNNDGYIDLWTADASGPSVRIYWGDSLSYSQNNYTSFTTTGAANCDAADLNGDGYGDFVVVHRMTPKVSIYWGTPTGPHQSFYFDIPTVHQESQAIYLADLNKDGYLDIITSLEIINNYAAILWGSQLGYNIANRTDLPIIYGIHNIEVADLNKDSWLDVLFTQYLHSDNIVYWGSDSGFYSVNHLLLPGPGSHGASVADLNNDTYLDIIFNAWYSDQSYIHWGDSAGYTLQILNPGSCYGGSTVQDFNHDSYLDILYHRTHNYQYIYWGSASGFSDDDTMIINYPGCTSGGIVTDLNGDMVVDIFLNRMSSSSTLLWGPAYTSNLSLPVNSDHHAMFREIGNVYNREFHDDYISSIFDAGDTVFWWRVNWNGHCGPGSDLLMFIRTGNTSMPDSTWSGWVPLDSNSLINDSLRSQYIQYRSRFCYSNIAYFPILYEVRIGYDSISGIASYSNKTRSPFLSISPNPFTIRTAISYSISTPSCHVYLRVYDITGRCIKTLINHKEYQGHHEIMWYGKDEKGTDAPKGIYFLDARIGDYESITKLVFID